MRNFEKKLHPCRLAVVLISAIAAVSSSAYAEIPSVGVKNAGNQESPRDLTIHPPGSGSPLVANGRTVVSGDFNGDGIRETAWRADGADRWVTTANDEMYDGRTDFHPNTQTLLIGDFDGDGADDIAWRRNGWRTWLISSVGRSIWKIRDDRTDYYYQDTRTLVGDFDSNGEDDIAWRRDGWVAWRVNSKGRSLWEIVDGRSDYHVEDTPTFVGDFDGNGKDDIAWRRNGWKAWRINSAHNCLWEIRDERSDYYHEDTPTFVGDFDGDGADDIAWRRNGWGTWRVNSASNPLWTIRDNRSDYYYQDTPTFVGDFNGDGADDIAWRRDGWGMFRVNSASNPLWSIVDDRTFDRSGPVLIGDFNGDGEDNLAFVPVGTEEWQVDGTSHNWTEPVIGLKFSFELIYADAYQDGTADDYVLLLRYPFGDAAIIYQPLAMVYFLRTVDIEIDSLMFECMSPEQQRALYEDCQANPVLASGLTKIDELGDSTHPNVTFHRASFNANAESILEMQIDAEYISVEGEIEWGESEIGVRVADFSGVSDAPWQSSVSFSVASGSISYEGLSGEVVFASVDGECYVHDKGFSIGVGATLIGVQGTATSQNGSSVMAGVGFGAGAGLGASWGENELYGFSADILVFKIGVYIHQDDLDIVVPIVLDGVTTTLEVVTPELPGTSKKSENLILKFFKWAGIY